MQTVYDDRVPNPEQFTPQRPIRVDDERWVRYGELVGDRDRSADLKAYIDWRLANPHANLNEVTNQVVLDFLVRVRLGPGDKRQAEIVELPGTEEPRVARLKTEIRKAIVDHFNPSTESEPAKASVKRTRRAAK